MAKLLAGVLVALSLIGFGCSVKPTSSAEAVSTNQSQDSVKSIVLENEKKIWEGFKAKDANAISALLADDIQVVTVNGRFNKSAFLTIIRQLEIPSYRITNAAVVSPSNDVAILTYDCQYDVKDESLTKQSSFQTTVWVNRGGKWVAIFNQETPR